jgi:UDP-GlcNAc3NAcA epimerase
VVLPLHPRTDARLRAAGLHARLATAPGVTLIEPVGYFELNALLCNAKALVTDSGGLQKEAYLAGVPCVTLRPNTEWIETVELGWNVLTDLDLDRVLAALQREPPAAAPPVYGDGHAGERVVAALETLA